MLIIENKIEYASFTSIWIESKASRTSHYLKAKEFKSLCILDDYDVEDIIKILKTCPHS